MYAAIDNPRAILAIALVLTPALLIAWAWLRLIRISRSDAAVSFRSLIVIFLFLMTISYTLTLASFFNDTVARYVERWHCFDTGVYFLISFLACVFSCWAAV